MNLRFLSVELSNFMSFENASVDLSENGFVKVCGENNNLPDNATSNGSGKSAVWEAINWCLTGETIRGSKDVVRHDSDDGCSVEIVFTVDGDSYDILRTKNHKKYKTNLFIKKNGEDVSGKGIRDTEKLLSLYLPDLDSNLINSIIILGQGLPKRFTNNTPAGRKDLLEVLSKSDFMIEDLKKRVTDRKNHLFSRKALLDKEESRYETLMELSQSRIDSLRQALENLKNEDLSEWIVKKELIEKELSDIENEMSDLSHKYGRSLSEEKDSLVADKMNLYKDSATTTELQNAEKSVALNDIIAKIFNLQSEIRSKESEINRLESIKDVCPTCGQKIPGVTKVDTSSLHTELESLKSEHIEKVKEKAEISEKFDKEIQDIKNSYSSSISVLDEKINTVSSEISRFSDLQIELNKRVEKIKKIETSIASHESDIKSLEKDVEDELNKEQEAHSGYLKKKEELEDVLKRLDIQNSFDNALKRDFRGILLQNCIRYINSKAKEYCLKIFDTDLIEFALDGNNISITYSGKEYESLSGGEKQKIDLIIQFSIRDMLCTYLNFNCNLLVLDELTDNLDPVGCKKVIDFISTELTDIDSVFIISHRADLEIPYDRTLNVTKNEQGISSCVLS